MLHLSESGYYRWLRNRGRHSSRQLLAGKVKKILEEHPDNRNYGVNRVCLALEQDGVDVSRRTMYRVMKENGWLHKRCIPHGITKITIEAQEQENLLKRDFSAQRPLEKFLTDITEVQCADGKQSLSGIGHCFDNARMESFFATLKKEKIYQIAAYKLPREQVKTIIFRYVFIYYNRVRIYMRNPLGLPPAKYREWVQAQTAA